MKSILIGLAVVALSIQAAGVAGAAETWATDLEGAQRQAAREGKKLLLDFTGSDWCVACRHLEREVFPTEEFARFAKDYVLVRLDYPVKTPLPEPQKSRNAALRDEFRIEGYPTVLILDVNRKELGRLVGYSSGSGVGAYLKKVAATLAAH